MGSTIITLTGVNLDDPLISSSTFPPGAIEVVTTVPLARISSVGVVLNNQITFSVTMSNSTGNTFGVTASIEVYFKPLNSLVAVGSNSLPLSITFGPQVYGPTSFGPYNSTFAVVQPSTGHRGGGDRITIYGCGFSYHTRTQIDVNLVVSGVPRALCFRGPGAGTPGDSLQIYGNGNPEFDRIECITNAFDCTTAVTPSNSRQVQVVLSNGVGSSTQAPASLSYSVGPIVQSVSPSRGPVGGGETVSLMGQNFFSSANSKGWNPRVRFTSTSTGGAVVTRNANLISDTLITVVTPTNFRYGETVTVDVDFVSPTGVVLCGAIPRSSTLTYSFGSICSSVSPASGYLSGGNLVTLSGVSFLRGRSAPTTTTTIQVCLQRLNPTLSSSGCTKYEPVSTDASSGFLLTDDTITFRMPSIRQSVNTTVGGNRLFGDMATIIVSFADIASSQVAPGTAGTYAACGMYRFGPTVTSVTPNAGSAGDAVTVSGTAFGDPLYLDDSRIDIGTLSTVDATTVVDNSATASVSMLLGSSSPSITANTIAGGVAGTLNDVSVTFNTCNTTVSSSSVQWGPVITSLIGPSGSSSTWGVLPAGGQSITVVGSGFGEFAGAIRCIIDGVPSSGSSSMDGTQVTCVTPAAPFGTTSKVTLQFGVLCRDGSALLPRYDWTQSLDSPQSLHYEPRITSFSPTFGYTSGNTGVTVFGEGFAGWPAYYCYFGHYTNGVAATVSTDGLSVQCATPTQRGEFNTDVPVHIVLSNNAAHADWKVRAPANQLYHYGPVCTAVSPQLALLRGNQPITLSGAGFQDCVYTNATQPIIRNCTMNNFRIHYYDSLSGSLLFSSDVNSSYTPGFSDTQYFSVYPAAAQCQQSVRVAIEYLDPIVSNDTQRFVQCRASAATNASQVAYSYGPRYVSQTSQYHRNGISYGWSGTTVTITGVNFHDPAIYTSDSNIACMFGAQAGVLSVPTSDTSITCTAPNGTFDQLVNITLTWSGASLSCSGPTALVAGKFHYGPVIDSITPDFGYVAGGTPVVIGGFAFDCCGITSIRCLFPDNYTPFVTASTTNTATCTVPGNTFIDRQINNIGLSFASSIFGNVSEAFQTLTEANSVLTYYYGPKVQSITPAKVRLSGLQSITVRGVGFADPYLTGTYCDYFANIDGRPIFATTTPTWSSGNVNAVAGAVTDTQIICPVQQYAHECGDSDQFRVRWTRNCTLLCGFRDQLGANYVKTVNSLTVPAVEVMPYYADAGSAVQTLTRIDYGPTIVSVTSSSNPSLRFPTSGGGTVTITGDNFGDWISGAATKDFGSETALCLFGVNRAASVSPIVAASNTIVCTVPPGDFGSSGVVAAILDPHTDANTKLSSAFRWKPSVMSLSQDWSSPHGGQVVIVNGEGFCNWNTVVCVFGNELFGTVESHRSNIIDDRTVECVTPALPVGITTLALHFCSTANSPCLTAASKDVVVASDNFVVIGVSGVSPEEAPVCGSTEITIVGTGFSRFENFACLLGEHAVDGRRLSDSNVACSAVDYSTETCNIVALVAERNGITYTLASNVLLEYSAPEILSVSPATSSIDQATQIVVTARHLQGTDLAGSYSCRFGSIVVPAEVTFVRNAQLGGELQQAITCKSPTRATNPDLTVGATEFEVSFNCRDPRSGEASFTASRFPYTFTQTPRVTVVSPAVGSELGTTSITVFGQSFQGGSGYYCAFGNPEDPEYQIVSATYVADGVPESRGSPVLTCVTPARIITAPIDVTVSISIDGGQTFYPATNTFLYDYALIECNEVVYSSSDIVTTSDASSLQVASLVLIVLSIVMSLLF
jgi:hypothetical protein